MGWEVSMKIFGVHCDGLTGDRENPGQPIFSRLWGSGFLPSSLQGVGLRPGAHPVLYLKNPPGIEAGQRRELLDDLAEMNRAHAEQVGDPDTQARIHAYDNGLPDADLRSRTHRCSR